MIIAISFILAFALAGFVLGILAYVKEEDCVLTVFRTEYPPAEITGAGMEQGTFEPRVVCVANGSWATSGHAPTAAITLEPEKSPDITILRKEGRWVQIGQHCYYHAAVYMSIPSAPATPGPTTPASTPPAQWDTAGYANMEVRFVCDSGDLWPLAAEPGKCVNGQFQLLNQNNVGLAQVRGGNTPGQAYCTVLNGGPDGYHSVLVPITFGGWEPTEYFAWETPVLAVSIAAPYTAANLLEFRAHGYYEVA